MKGLHCSAEELEFIPVGNGAPLKDKVKENKCKAQAQVAMVQQYEEGTEAVKMGESRNIYEDVRKSQECLVLPSNEIANTERGTGVRAGKLLRYPWGSKWSYPICPWGR